MTMIASLADIEQGFIITFLYSGGAKD